MSTETNTDNNGTKDGKDEDVEPPNELNDPEEEKPKDDKETNDMEESKNVRRSERIRKQRYDIKPEEIGECDDKNDQDYN